MWRTKLNRKILLGLGALGAAAVAAFYLLPRSQEETPPPPQDYVLSAPASVEPGTTLTLTVSPTPTIAWSILEVNSGMTVNGNANVNNIAIPIDSNVSSGTLFNFKAIIGALITNTVAVVVTVYGHTSTFTFVLNNVPITYTSVYLLDPSGSNEWLHMGQTNGSGQLSLSAIPGSVMTFKVDTYIGSTTILSGQYTYIVYCS